MKSIDLNVFYCPQCGAVPTSEMSTCDKGRVVFHCTKRTDCEVLNDLAERGFDVKRKAPEGAGTS